MTSNQDRAVAVLNKHWSVAQETGQDDEAVCCARALADAGLITPDLPEPDEEGGWPWLRVDLEKDIFEHITLGPGDGTCMAIRDTPVSNTGVFYENLTPEDMRIIGMNFLAAADHMEENTNG